jgi:hypothetical protein
MSERIEGDGSWYALKGEDGGWTSYWKAEPPRIDKMLVWLPGWAADRFTRANLLDLLDNLSTKNQQTYSVGFVAEKKCMQEELRMMLGIESKE